MPIKFLPLLLPAFFVVSCTPKPESQQINNRRIQKVRTVEVLSEKITPTLHSFGSVSFEHKADITASVEGVIHTILREEGNLVNKQDALVKMRNVQLEIQKEKAAAALKMAQTEAALAESSLLDARLQMKSRFLEAEKNQMELEQQLLNLQRQEKDLEEKKLLLDAGGLTREAVEKLEWELQAARTAYSLAQKNREVLLIGLRDEDLLAHGMQPSSDTDLRNEQLIHINTLTLQAKLGVAQSRVSTARQELSSVNQLIRELTLRSPLTGLVGAVYLEEGERAKAGDKILTVFNTANVHVVFPVQESDLSRIREGQKAFITVDSLGPVRLEGVIRYISPTVDPQSGNITVKVLLANSKGLLKPGMFARIEIIHGSPRNVIMIPDSALIRKEKNKADVLLVNNGHILFRSVELGEMHNDRYPVLKGLKEGQILVDSPSPVLKEGDEVETY